MHSAGTLGPGALTFSYSVSHSLSNPFDVGIYRSASSSLKPAAAVAIANVQVSGQELLKGSHTVTVSVASGQLTQDWLQPDPAHPYVLAVADPANVTRASDGAHDTASFRVYVIAAVVPGFGESDPSTPPQWVQDMAAALHTPQNGPGFYQVIPFGWQSLAPTPGLAVQAGITLADEIKTAAQTMSKNLHLKSTDVIDVTLIGHSRGTVVIGVAMQQLETGVIPQLKHGYREMLLIDPHPANQQFGGNASVNPDFAGQTAFALYWQYEGTVQDPGVVVPSDVAYAKEWYQHSSYSDFAALSEEGQLNLWGLTPASINVQSQNTVFTSEELTRDTYNGLPIGHSEITDWFQANVVPVLLEPSY